MVEEVGTGSERRKRRVLVMISISNRTEVMSVSVSYLEKGKNGFNTVYVGTEHTTLYRSDDGGESWQRMSSLNNLKSSSVWSFPPRPWTSHVRWIEPDKSNGCRCL
jgi:hypothetical protein